MAALRLICAAPTVNPAAGGLCSTLPSLLKYRATNSHRGLCTRLPPNVMPLSWKTNRPQSRVRSHLPVPVDELANLVRPILETLSFAPLARADCLAEAPSLPPHNTMTNAYKALKGRTRLLLVEKWRRLAPPPPILYLPIVIDPPPVYGIGHVHGRSYPPDESPEELSCRPPLMLKGR